MSRRLHFRLRMRLLGPRLLLRERAVERADHVTHLRLPVQPGRTRVQRLVGRCDLVHARALVARVTSRDVTFRFLPVNTNRDERISDLHSIILQLVGDSSSLSFEIDLGQHFGFLLTIPTEWSRFRRATLAVYR